jgi:hypothetical protein
MSNSYPFGIAALALIVSGCSTFAPTYIKDADSKATVGYEELSVLLAKADLGAFEARSSYAEQVDKYAGVVSKFMVARLAFAQSGGGAGITRAEAATTLDALIGNCIQLVELLASEHEAAGIVPRTGATQPVQVGCDAAVKAIRATK